MMYSAEVWPRGVEKGELNMLKHDVFIGSMTGGSFRVDLYSPTKCIHRKNNRGECIGELIFSNKMYS